MRRQKAYQQLEEDDLIDEAKDVDNYLDADFEEL